MNTYLEHHGIKGMRWGVRRYQNKDGTRTRAGKRRRLIMSREEHYSRNKLNKKLPKTLEEAQALGWHEVVANAHQFTASTKNGNIKLVDEFGNREAVYDSIGKLIKTDIDMGSYNFSPSEISKIGHVKDDIVPYILYGNTKNDPTTKIQRTIALSGHYTKKMKRS